MFGTLYTVPPVPYAPLCSRTALLLFRHTLSPILILRHIKSLSQGQDTPRICVCEEREKHWTGLAFLMKLRRKVRTSPWVIFIGSQSMFLLTAPSVFPRHLLFCFVQARSHNLSLKNWMNSKFCFNCLWKTIYFWVLRCCLPKSFH